MNTREIQLRKLGFVSNQHEQAYTLSKYNNCWFIDFWKIIDYNDYKWDIIINELVCELEKSKIDFTNHLKGSEGYNFAQKEFKKKLKDKYNHYNSKLHQLSVPKMGRTVYQLEELKLSSKIELLKELMNEST